MDHLTAFGHVAMTNGAYAAGLALVLLVAHHPTRINVSFSLVYLFLGLATLTAVPSADRVDPDHPGWLPYLCAAAVFGFAMNAASYMQCLLETAQPSQGRRSPVRIAVTICYSQAVLAGLLFALFPEQVFNDLLFSANEPGFWSSSTTWFLGGAFAVINAVFIGSWVALARLHLDVGERLRAICAALLSLSVAGTLFLPLPAATVSFGVGILIGIYGQFRYFTAQGERAAFLGRFLSSQVTESVRADGLSAVMQPGERTVTVVACDLRGFTPYAEAVPSQAVIDLLNEYYDAVGVAVAEVSGTVKDYAGDGVLIVIGAPIARDDHAAAGLTLARRLHEVVAPVRDHWGTGPHPLGLGVGVATGRVAVGAVGSSSRMEYTAVGTAVNLAARLCSAAAAGETLVDQSTAELAGQAGLQSRGSMPIKGLSTDHTVFALSEP